MKIKKVEKITDEQWLNLYATTYLHNRRKGRWVFASRRDQDEESTTPDAMIIVPVLKEKRRRDRLVMIKEYRIPLQGYNYAFPAGLVDDGEDPNETVRREVREESGLDLVKIHRISPMLNSSAGLTDERIMMAFVEVQRSKDDSQILEDSEDIEVVLLDLKGVKKLCNDPDLQIDAKAWCVLFICQQLGRLDIWNS